jgi:hypothetical protein
MDLEKIANAFATASAACTNSINRVNNLECDLETRFVLFDGKCQAQYDSKYAAKAS